MLAVLAAAALAAAPGAPPASGRYGDSLKLAFSRGRVTGAFSDSRAGNGSPERPQFSCGFLLTGAWRGDHADVQTWWPGETDPDTSIPGRLTVRGAAASLKLARQPGGCDMTGDDLATEGYGEALQRRRPWIEVREVRAGKSFFWPKLGGARSRAYVVEHDAVAVLARSGGWVEAEYVDGSRPIHGWLAEGDLYPAVP